MDNQYKTIDLSYLNSIADGDASIIRELAKIFINQIPEFTNGLSHAFEYGNWNSVSAIAHKAKSSVISMGMVELGEIDLKNLELLAKHRRKNELLVKSEQTPPDIVELDKLTHSLSGCSKEQQQWIIENDSDVIITKIIDKFASNCKNAIIELQTVL